MRGLVNAIAAVGVIVVACCGERATAQSLQTNSARSCAVCHLEWMQAFSDPDATPLIPRPSQPAVADSDTCLGCHDGAVGDSRRRVWLEHGHRRGITPPDDMIVPSRLPLADGKISCLTCHTAHAGRGPETIATAIFQRMPGERSELCLACHENRGGEGQQNHHPLVDMEQPVPDALRGGLAHFGPQGKSVTCQSCHTPHGGQSDFLLIQDNGVDENCVACHEVATPGFNASPGEHHPLHAALTPEARDAVTTWHPDLAGADALSCRSCHAMHDSKSADQLLVQPLEDSGLCLSCHTSFDSITESAHDLRVSAPEEKNIAGHTADQTGQCSACHMVHRSARDSDEVATIDAASGLNQRCTTCHAAGECGESAGGLTLHHPAGDATDAVHCMRCHNPHDTTHPRFLRASPKAVCAECHAEQTERLSGGHTFSTRPELRNALDRTADEAGQCGFCHSVHQANGPMLWVATPDAPPTADAFCTTCHRQDGVAGEMIPPPMRHPRDVAGPAGAASVLPLFDAGGQVASDGAIACATCHDPHGDANASAALLRGEGQSVCLTCHTQMAAVTDSPHGAKSLAAAAQEAQPIVDPASCGPCHAVHQTGHASLLWASPIDATARLPDAQRCYGCHNSSEHQLPRHAPIPIDEGQDQLPLVAGNGAPVGMGWISCSTCHLPHSRDVAHPGQGRPSDESGDTAAMIRAAKPMIREYMPPNTCSQCHGFDGLIRFFRFHDIAASAQ